MVAVAAIGFAVPAHAEVLIFDIALSGENQVPPLLAAASGTALVTFDTETLELRWTLDFSGLTGAPTAAHFHGPADIGANGPVSVPIEDLTSPSERFVILTDAQAEELLDGLWYINVHTMAHGGGELRGQVVAPD